MYTDLPWIALALAACAIGLWKFMPNSRGRFRSALGFLALWVIPWSGAFAASWVHMSVPVTRELAFALIELAAVQVVAGLLFDLAVEKAGVPRFAAEMVVVLCYLLVIVNIFFRLGVNLTGIFATSAVAAAVVGFALQDMLGNLASGIALEFENDIKVGDFIKCADAAGWVKHVRLRHTSIETPDGDFVMVPNSVLTRSPVVVLSRLRRQFIPFAMPYSCDPHELTDAVTLALRASPIPDVASDPPPSCVVLELAPGHIRYAAVVWTLKPGEEAVGVSAVLSRIYFGLKRAGIPVAEITNLLEMRAATDNAGASANPADMLRRTMIFRLLSDDNLLELGAKLRHLSFAPGELIVRQGDAGDSMYIVISGQVTINYAGKDGLEMQVAVVSSGDFFGEASLLTGETRNSSAVALTRVDCYELQKAGLEGVLGSRADLAEDMSVVLAHRLAELDSTRQRLHLETARLEHSQTQILARIRKFFGFETNSAKV